MNKKQHIRLTETELRDMVRNEVRRVLKESTGEFEYGDSQDLGKGRHRQVIIFNGHEIGYLLTIEKNLLAPLEEVYLLPDVEYGISEPTDGLLDGKKGWIDFKRFTTYDEAFSYARQNEEQLAYMFEYGDWD